MQRSQIEDEPSSIPVERSVLEAVDVRRLIAGIVVMMVMVRVLFVFGYAAAAVGRGHETVETVADDALAPLARDVGDVGDGGAVPTLGRVSGEGNHAATTAFEIARGVDALPRARVVAVDAARQPAVPPLGAGAAAEPAPSVVAAGLLRGTPALGDALAVADLERRGAYALRGVVLREGHESVCALERALFLVGADGLGVVREVAVVLGSR